MSEVFDDYDHFVDTLLSSPSKNLELLIEHLRSIDSEDLNTARLMTGAAGMSSESGEFMEIVKKMFFQGKPCDETTIFHMKRELGDIMFYLMVACQALNLSVLDVIKENIVKLQSRYPGGKFDIGHSEIRKDGDL